MSEASGTPVEPRDVVDIETAGAADHRTLPVVDLDAQADGAGFGDDPPGSPSILLGILYGLLAAAVAAFGWVLASIGTKSQLVYLAVAVGIAVGYFVNVGARRGSVLTAAVAVVITLVGCTGGFYYVSRSSLIRRGYVRLVGDDRSIPLMPSYRLVRDVLRVNLRSNVAPYLYLVLAMAVAAYFGRRGLDATKRRADH